MAIKLNILCCHLQTQVFSCESQLRFFAYSDFSGSLGNPWAVGLKIFKSEVKCSIKIKKKKREGKEKNPHLQAKWLLCSYSKPSFFAIWRKRDQLKQYTITCLHSKFIPEKQIYKGNSAQWQHHQFSLKQHDCLAKTMATAQTLTCNPALLNQTSSESVITIVTLSYYMETCGTTVGY